MARRKTTPKAVTVLETKTNCDLANEALKEKGYTFELDRQQFETLLLGEDLPKNREELNQLNELSKVLFHRMLDQNSIRKYGTSCQTTNKNIYGQIKKDLMKVLVIVKPFAQEA